jgi:hypothetical protein
LSGGLRNRRLRLKMLVLAVLVILNVISVQTLGAIDQGLTASVGVLEDA